ncbi:L,D-transpeptidase family protein [Thioalkalicoccus limnaeus]|uniref:L,D-transpeptidase family protein n=1 Tax=Thioalkalicoccus limnaeus TaxID=120681 RepID=A0ABV4BBT4_9GAMM
MNHNTTSAFSMPRVWLAAALLLAGTGIGGTGHAELYQLQRATDDVVGAAFFVRSRSEDTLLDIARLNGFGHDDMRSANPRVDMWVPGDGANVLIPNRFVLPDAPREGIVLNLAEKRLYFFPPGEPTKVHSFPISIGREGHNTPVGQFHILAKNENPTWRPPAWIREQRAKEGRPIPEVVPPGPDNPLGDFAMRLSDPSYLIHGTNRPWGLGMEVSAGCIRMYPEDIAHLFPMVDLKTQVTIVDQPVKIGWYGDELYLEVHKKEGESIRDPREVIPAALAGDPGVFIDWGAVRRTLEARTGLPKLVGGRNASANWHHLDMIF